MVERKTFKPPHLRITPAMSVAWFVVVVVAFVADYGSTGLADTLFRFPTSSETQGQSVGFSGKNVSLVADILDFPEGFKIC